MNKAEIDRYLPKAYLALQAFDVAQDGKIPNGFRSYISAFGASILMGSLSAAVSFNSYQNNAKLQRDSLMKAIYYLITESDDASAVEGTSLLQYVNTHLHEEDDIKEKIYNATIALKIAMNMYVLTEE